MNWIVEEKKQNTQAQTFPIAGLLGVAFVVLKLTGFIAWSWLWVTAPFWMPLALIAVLLIVACVVMSIKDLFS